MQNTSSIGNLSRGSINAVVAGNHDVSDFSRIALKPDHEKFPLWIIWL